MTDEACTQKEHKANDRQYRIRKLNDQLRFRGLGGIVILTEGISALPMPTIGSIMMELAYFDDFTNGNDPWSEHDFGAFKYRDMSIIWKIVYYDKSRTCHSPDPSDSSVTTRVLTVMLAEEY